MQTYFQMQVSPRPSHMWSFGHLLSALLLGLLLFQVSCDFVETVLKEVQGETQIGLGSMLSLVSIFVPKTCQWCFSSDLALRNNAGWNCLRRRRCLRTKTYQRWQGAWRKWDRQGQARCHRTWLRATTRVEVKPEMRNKDKSFWVSCFHIHS